MSAMGASNPRLSEDDRYELASRAQNQQRLNSPRHLIMLGVLLSLIAIIVLVVGWQTRARAIKKNERMALDLVKIEGLIGEVRALQLAQQNSGQNDLYKPLPDILSQIQGYAQQAGLENELGLPRNPGTRPEGNALLKTYPYTVRDPSIASLLDWVRISTRQIPGLEVRELSLQPGNQYWTMSVVLSRYERKP